MKVVEDLKDCTDSRFKGNGIIWFLENASLEIGTFCCSTKKLSELLTRACTLKCMSHKITRTWNSFSVDVAWDWRCSQSALLSWAWIESNWTKVISRFNEESPAESTEYANISNRWWQLQAKSDGTSKTGKHMLDEENCVKVPKRWSIDKQSLWRNVQWSKKTMMLLITSTHCLTEFKILSLCFMASGSSP